MTIQQRIEHVETHLRKFEPGHLILPPVAETYRLDERMADTHVPGVGVAVIRDNKIAWAKGYGLLKAGEDRPVTPHTLFQACSVSKMVTAALALRLVETGVLDLDKDVNRYLSSWRVLDNEHTQDAPVTLRGLLSHQAGINRPDGGFEWDDGTAPTVVQILKGEPPSRVQPARVICPPGTQWGYANFGYIIIQVMLEDVLGRPFAELAQDELFTPLGMTSSTFSYPLDDTWAPREITLHDSQGHPTHPGMIPSAVAHGGLMTTASDLATFGIALLQAYRGQPDPILSQATVRLMFRPTRRVDDLSVLGFPFGQGLGVFLVGEGDSRVVFHPGGNDPGASCLICLLPDAGKGAVIMTNGLQGFSLSLEILAAIAEVDVWH